MKYDLNIGDLVMTWDAETESEVLGQIIEELNDEFALNTIKVKWFREEYDELDHFDSDVANFRMFYLNWEATQNG
jgi:hypothetical protein